MVAFLGAVLSQLIKSGIIVIMGGVGAFVGIKLRKNKDAKN